MKIKYIFFLLLLFGCEKDDYSLELYNEPFFGFSSSLVETKNREFLLAGWGNESLSSITENGIVI